MTPAQRPANPFDLDTAELESMEAILDSFNDQATLETGGIIEARVIDFDERDVFFDLGGKQDGRCSRQEFEDLPSRGDTVPVVVTSRAADGMIRLSRQEAERRLAWEHIKEAHSHQATLHGVINKHLNQGYIVDCGGISLFMPLSHSDIKTRLRNRHAVGKKLDFKIIDLKDRHRSAVVSHRLILEEHNDESWNELSAQHKEGDVVPGLITKKVSFGLFIKICGVEGLLHQSDISWKKFVSFKNRFKVGETIEVKILSMDREHNRLSLGLKQLTEDPWGWAQRELAVGNVVRGVVTSVTDYGAFVELMEGLEGLIHVSEISWARRPGHPKKHVQVGQEIEAQVLDLDFDQKRISLGLRQLQTDPWEEMGDSIKVGDVREGRVISITKFGAFVEVKENIEGLIHFNDYSWEDRPDKKLLTKGQTVKFKILDINHEERRVACGIKQLTPSPYEVLAQKYKKGAVVNGKITRITGFGVFVDIGEGFEGLVHISRIPRPHGEAIPLEQRFSVGEEVSAVMQHIDVEGRKISLSIKAYEQKKEREIIEQYIKRGDEPSTSSLASFLKK
ncbi:MAG: 30S ribosomal protein S1 [Leptospiraceae bacterium]|nr:30S ribosomal protein S1 [Leptospiraceae bacterium]